MRNRTRYALASLLLLINLRGEGQTSDKITLNVDNMPVEQVVAMVAKSQQLGFAIGPGVKERVTLHLHQARWQEVLQLIAELSESTVVISGNTIRLMPADPQATAQANEEVAMNVSSRRFPLIYNSALQLRELLMQSSAKILTSQGHASVDHTMNALIVRDTIQALERVKHWIAIVEQPQPQVEIIAHIVTISEHQLHQLGVDWQSSQWDAEHEAGSNAHINIPLGVSSPTLSAKLALARLHSQLLSLELSALELENEIDIIASPRLVTTHKGLASIKQGSEIPYLVSGQRKDDSPTVQFKEAVLGMQITPEILGEQHIRLHLHLSQNVPGKAIQEGDNTPLSIDKQEIETQVIVKNGQTLALGGIFQQQNTVGQHRVPWFAHLPWIGQLFRRDLAQQQKRELVVFITPNLLYLSKLDQNMSAETAQSLTWPFN